MIYARWKDTGFTQEPLHGRHRAQGSLGLELHLQIVELKPLRHCIRLKPRCLTSSPQLQHQIRVRTWRTLLPSCFHTLIFFVHLVRKVFFKSYICFLSSGRAIWTISFFLSLPTFSSILVTHSFLFSYHVTVRSHAYSLMGSTRWVSMESSETLPDNTQSTEQKERLAISWGHMGSTLISWMLDSHIVCSYCFPYRNKRFFKFQSTIYIVC